MFSFSGSLKTHDFDVTEDCVIIIKWSWCQINQMELSINKLHLFLISVAYLLSMHLLIG